MEITDIGNRFMRKIFSQSVASNPIDDRARRAFGAARTVKGYLAAHQNPRPAGIVLMTTTPSSSPWPWHSITDDQWKVEMRANNGNLISVLLRHPEISRDSDFLALFDKCETEYQACLKRLKWAWVGRDKNAFVEKVLNPIKPELDKLVDAFVSWATDNRERVWIALEEMAVDEKYQSGNAMSDLRRINADWV